MHSMCIPLRISVAILFAIEFLKVLESWVVLRSVVCEGVGL